MKGALFVMACGVALGLFFVRVQEALGLSKGAMSIALTVLAAALLLRLALRWLRFVESWREDEGDY